VVRITFVRRCLVVGAALAAVGLLIAPLSTFAASKTAGQWLASSKASAKGEPSFHYVATTTYPTQSVTITGDVSALEGQQTIVNHENGEVGHVTVSLVGGSVYFEGDEAGLAGFMGLPAPLASQYVGQWISLTKADKGFSTTVAGLTTSSALSQIQMPKSLSLHGTSGMLGHRVLAIGGTHSAIQPGSTDKALISVRLYVDTTGKPLPVLYTGHATVGKKKVAQSISFSAWGAEVNVTAPAVSTPAGALGASPVEV
jgi:hypothetical protein